MDREEAQKKAYDLATIYNTTDLADTIHAMELDAIINAKDQEEAQKKAKNLVNIVQAMELNIIIKPGTKRRRK